MGPLLVTKYVLFTGNLLKKGSYICNVSSKVRHPGHAHCSAACSLLSIHSWCQLFFTLG